MIVLCAGAIGKTKCTAMKQEERTKLMRYIASSGQRLIISNLWCLLLLNITYHKRA